jgi:DUF1680 family protein
MPPDHGLSRREMLALLGMGAVATAVRPRAVVAAAPLAAPPRLRPFPLADVRLLDGPFRDAQRRDARYLLSLEPDRLLHNFRVNAGLPPKAPAYGGWESEEPWVEIRCQGHTLGHYLSAVAMMYAATGDARFAERAAHVVAELRACQRARGDGLVCAFPDGARPLDEAVAGRPFPGVPWYTMHKIFAGLRDAHVYAATPGALAALVDLTEWTRRTTRGMTDAAMQRMLDTEHGGMTEVLADASALAAEPTYLALARRFAHRRVLEPLAEGRDVLDGLHANTQIPKLIGCQRVHELTDVPAYGAAARFFWSSVTRRRSFVTGGCGDNEHFFPVGEFARHLGSAKTMETCCTHNMLRLTRALFTAQPDAAYADYYERALYNGILASQDPDSGLMTYFQATRPGYVRLYHTPTESFWCCTGTGMENHAAYGQAIYFEDGDTLWVNLFVASSVTWRSRGLTLTQTTRFPDEDTTRFTIDAASPTPTTLRVRRPGWCPDMSLSVNGQRWDAAPDDTGYVPIQRRWRAGDRVEVHLPMTLGVEPLPEAPDVVAFVCGPIVLAGRLGTAGVTPEGQIIKNERESGTMLNAPVEVPVLTGDVADLVRRVRPAPGAPLNFQTAGPGRPRDVRLGPYFRLAHERYNLYWSVAATQEQRDVERVVRLVAGGVLADATFTFVDDATGHRYTTPADAAAEARLRPASAYQDWRYWNGLLNLALLRVAEATGDPRYRDFVLRNIRFAFDAAPYFEQRYRGEDKWAYPFGQYIVMQELDDYGAMGASVIEAYAFEPDARYRRYVEAAAAYASTNQGRLADGTLARSFPRQWTVWADDLFMSVPFLARMAELAGDPRYLDDAVQQVVRYHRYLFDEGAGLMVHNWYSGTRRPGVAFWGRANGWAIVAQVDLLDRLPPTHPQRDTLLVLFRRHIEGLARHQTSDGLWHQLLDREDSYLETSASAMITYAVARGVNQGYLDGTWARVAREGWTGVATRIRQDGMIEGICTGTSVSDDIQDYYRRPTPLNDVHGLGTVLLAGSEILARVQGPEHPRGLRGDR